MAYQAKISSKSPAAIVVMIDQSGSMSERITWNGSQITKAEAVSEVINNLLWEFVCRSRSENGYRHYYDIMVIGYSGSGVKSLLNCERSYFVTTSELMGSVVRSESIQRQRQLPDGRTIITNTAQKIWVEITATGRTPMRAALKKVYSELKNWCKTHPDSFPPMVINISDGEATDGSHEQMKEAAQKVQSLETKDGNTLIMNIHLSNSSTDSKIFCHSKEQLPDDKHAHLLFDLSSKLPAIFLTEIEYEQGQEPRAMAFNASIADLVRLLNIGSTTINQNITL